MIDRFPNQTGLSSDQAIGLRRPIAQMWGALADGVTDDAPAINLAIAAIVANNGAELFLPRGTYLLKSPLVIPSGAAKFAIVGEGKATLLKRGADMPDGQGLIDISGEDVSIESLAITHDVTTSTGLLYTDFGSDPMHNLLTKNSSIWIHGGAKRIKIRDLYIYHGSGYGVLIDARTADIEDVEVSGCTFENNRQHLFGTDPADLNYGSWTGGIHYQSDGTNYCVRRLLVMGNTFNRNTGTACWGHLYALNKLHEEVRIIGNTVMDNGYHGLQLGGVNGGVMADNKLRRIGYICSDDTSPSVPKYLSGAYASAIDFSGLVLHATVSGNSVVSANGDCFDFDGLAYSTITGNSCTIPSVGDPEYTEDKISQIGPGGTGNNWTYGMQTGNTNQDKGGTGLVIAGNVFRNMGGGAIRLYAARDCVVYDNEIHHPSTYNERPITIGNVGTLATQRSYGNVIYNNRISFDANDAAIWENDQSGSYPFQASDKNYVFGNRIFSTANCYEFKKDANSGSSTSVIISTNDPSVAQPEETIIAREATGASAALKIYKNIAGTTTQILQLQDSNYLLNVSNAGQIRTGIYATGNRTTAAFADCIVTGKLYADAFVVVKDYGSGTFLDAEADSLDDFYALIRYNRGLRRWQHSIWTSGGLRTWQNFGQPEDPDLSVQYNDGGVFAGTSDLIWNKTNRRLEITTASGQAGLGIANGFVDADGGFYTDAVSDEAIKATGQSGLGGGGVACRQLNIYRADGGLTGWDTVIDGNRNASFLAVNAGTVTSAGSGTVSAQYGFYSPGTADNVINIPSGGAWCNKLISKTAVYVVTSTLSQPSPAAGYGGMHHYSGTTYRFWNGTAWFNVDLGSIGGGITSINSQTGPSITIQGTTNRITVSSASNVITISAPQDLHTSAAVTFDRMSLGGALGGAVLVLNNGYVDANDGFYTSSTAYNAIQAPSGGARLGTVNLEKTTDAPLRIKAGASLAQTDTTFAFIWFDSSTRQLRIKYYDGAAWQDKAFQLA